MVSDIATKSVVSIDSSSNIEDAAKLMTDSNVGTLVVVENNTHVGIVTDRDFTTKVTTGKHLILESIKNIMTSPIISISNNDSVSNAAKIMQENKIKKLPVIDNNEIHGIITATDIVNQLANNKKEELEKFYLQTISKIYQNYDPFE